jgi:hypothetical protein
MMLSETVSGSGLSSFAEISLVLFFIAFVSLVISVVVRSKAQVEHDSRLPLDDSPTASVSGFHTGSTSSSHLDSQSNRHG